MAIFNQSTPPKRDSAPPASNESALKKEPDTANEFSYGQPQSVASNASPAPRAAERAVEREGKDTQKESLIASDISIEGKIEGAGHIRIAGRFKGDVHVQGDLTIEHGAKLNGGVRARKVVVAGELEGNVDSAQRLELLDTGVIVGDIKAGTVIVAPGSRMRGQVEFGWDDKDAKTTGKPENKSSESKTADGSRNESGKLEAGATS